MMVRHHPCACASDHAELYYLRPAAPEGNRKSVLVNNKALLIVIGKFLKPQMGHYSEGRVYH